MGELNMKNLKKLTAIVLSTMFVSMQMSFATCTMDTGLGNGLGGASINSTKGGFEGMTTGTNSADLNFSSNSVVNWNTLNVNKGETLNFNAVNGSKNLTVLNTVNQGMSKLYGDINANKGISNLIISNPNGMLFDGTHFTSAGDIIITTQDMTNLTLNDLTNKNFKKGEFKNLYDCNGNPIGIQAKNNTTFEVAGKLNIITQNQKTSISGKQKLITNNGQDYLEFDGHACNNCTNKAINDHGNIIIVDINTAENLPKQTVKPDTEYHQNPHYYDHHNTPKRHYRTHGKPQGNQDFIVSNGHVGYNITKDFQRVKPITKHHNHLGFNQGTKPGFNPNQGKLPGFNPNQGTKPGFNPNQGKLPGFNPNQGTKPGFNPNQGKLPGFNPNQGKKPGFNPNQGQLSGFNPNQGTKPGFNPNQGKEPDFIVSNGQVGYNITKDFQRVKPVTKSNDVLTDKMPGHDFLDKTNTGIPQYGQPAVSQTTYTPVAPITSVKKLDASDYTKTSTNINTGITNPNPTKPHTPCSGSSCSANGFGNTYTNISNPIVNNQMPNVIKTNNTASTTNVKLSEQYYVRGLQKMVLGDLEGGKADFTKAIENNSQNADAYYYRANINKQLGNMDGFNADFSQAASIDTKFQRVAPVNTVAYGIK